MPKRTYAEIFLDKLTELSGDEPCLIGNRTRRKALGWNEDCYDWIKSQLYEEGLIIIGRGKGGSVGLANVPGSEALQLFISYSHADQALKSELVKHLEPLKRLNLIETWHDGVFETWRRMGSGDFGTTRASGHYTFASEHRLHKLTILL